MGLFDFFKGPDINQGVKEYRESKGGILLDVRTPQEYKVGHIAGSRNIPLQNIRQAVNIIKNKKTDSKNGSVFLLQFFKEEEKLCQ